MINTRKAKVLTEVWVDINPLDIKKGMVFKLFEEDGIPVLYNGNDIFVASADSFMNDDGISITYVYDNPPRLLETNRWIPVTERLPEKSEKGV